jgi:hypothetical protein
MKAATAGQATKVKKATATSISCIRIDSLKRPFAQEILNSNVLIELW